LSALAGAAAGEHEGWIGELSAVESAARAAEQAELDDDRTPLHPMRLVRRTQALLDRDAIVVIDRRRLRLLRWAGHRQLRAGSVAGQRPFGCLGSGPGYALAAKLARPDGRWCCCRATGRSAFSGMEWDTLVRPRLSRSFGDRHNGIWALEKHPDGAAVTATPVVADLRPGTRYDEVVHRAGWTR
jgi:acetolactate synthase-1/2/3 large subunit